MKVLFKNKRKILKVIIFIFAIGNYCYAMENPIPGGFKSLEYKLIFLGDVGVGKSCIINRYLDNIFSEDYKETKGIDVLFEQVKNTYINLLLYDTSGAEKYSSIRKNHIGKADIFLLVYDVNSKKSFDNLLNWLKDLEDIKKDKFIFVVGNKIDLAKQRVVNKEEAKKFAEDREFLFYEVSAKTGEGVNELFTDIINFINDKNIINNKNSINDQNLKNCCEWCC